MVPLNDEESLDQTGKAGATSFFALPNPPKKPGEQPSPLKRADPIAIASAPGAPPPGMPPGAGGYIPVGAVPPAVVPMAPIGIQGPIASPHGLIPASSAPEIDPNSARATSYRVFAVVGGLVFMVFSVTIVAVLLLASVVFLPEVSGGGGTAVVAPITAPPTPKRAVDTGEDKVAEAPPLTDKGKPKPKPTPSPGPRPDPGPKPPPAPPKPTTTPGTVTITLGAGAPAFASFEVSCPNEGFRERAPFAGGTASLPGVPRGECRLYFKGGAPVSIPISGGTSLTCVFSGNTPQCT